MYKQKTASGINISIFKHKCELFSTKKRRYVIFP